jgi:hypothetical protein
MAQYTAHTKAVSTGDTVKYYISINGQDIELQGYPNNSTLTFPAASTTTATFSWTNGNETDVLPKPPVDYKESMEKLNKAMKNLGGAFRKLEKKLADMPKVIEVDIFNRIGDTIYGAGAEVKIGDKVILEDRNTDVQLEAEVEFVEDGSVGYRVA